MKKLNKEVVEFWSKIFFRHFGNYDPDIGLYEDVFIPSNVKIPFNVKDNKSNFLELGYKDICYKCNNKLQNSEYCNDKLFCKTCGIYI